MGSLNTDGSFIEQKRNSIRRLGGAFTESADRVETRTVLSPNNTLFSPNNPDKDLVQIGASKLDDCIKLTNANSDSLVERVCKTGIDL